MAGEAAGQGHPEAGHEQGQSQESRTVPDDLILQEGQLPDSLVDRFENREQLRYYDVAELAEVSRRTSREALRRLQTAGRGLGGGTHPDRRAAA